MLEWIPKIFETALFANKMFPCAQYTIVLIFRKERALRIGMVLRIPRIKMDIENGITKKA